MALTILAVVAGKVIYLLAESNVKRELVDVSVIIKDVIEQPAWFVVNSSKVIIEVPEERRGIWKSLTSGPGKVNP